MASFFQKSLKGNNFLLFPKGIKVHIKFTDTVGKYHVYGLLCRGTLLANDV